MSGGNSYPISREYQKLLGENLDFFEEVLNLYSETGLGFMATDADSKLQTEVQEDGNLSLKLSIALDNNYDKSDGRIYLEDQFIFDGKTKAFQKYQRNFSLAGTLSDDHPFRDFQKTLSEKPTPDDQKFQAFAQTLFKARPQSLGEKWFQVKKDRAADYEGLASTLDTLEAPFQLHSKAAQNSYSLFSQGKNTVLLLNWATQDSDENEAGPVMLQEKFIFDSKGGILQDYGRTWQINPDYSDRDEAQGWANRLHQEANGLPQDPQELLYNFAKLLYPAGGFAPLNDESIKILSKYWEAYTLPLATAVQKADPEWTIRTKDSASGIQVRQWETGKELVLSLVIENAIDPSKARLQVFEHFFQDEQGNWTAHHRRYVPDQEFAEDKKLAKKLDGLNQKTSVFSEVHAALAKDLTAFAPELKPSTPPKTLGMHAAQEALWQVQEPKIKQGHADSEKINYETNEGLPDDNGALRAVSVIGALALEQLSKKQSRSQAWFASNSGLEFETQEADIKNLFESTIQFAQAHPDGEPMELLRAAGALTGHQALVDRLSRNVWAQKINEASLEIDPNHRAKAWLEIATKDLWDAELVGTAQVMVSQVKDHEGLEKSAGEFLALIEGGGSWGTKGEFVSPKILSDLGDPWMIGGMMAAPLAGAAAEAGILSRFGKSKKYLALAAGIGLEAGTFTAISDLGLSLERDPGEVWNQFGSQTLATALMFSFLRVGHKVTGRTRAAMAEGAWGPRLGGEVQVPAQVAWPRSASGSVITAPNPQLTQLTRTGEFLSGTMNHGAGISAMWLSQSLASTWMPQLPQQDWRGGIFDAMLGYGHAMMGFRMADGLSLGGLHRSLAQIRMGIQDYDTQFIRSEKIESDTLDQNLKNVLNQHAAKAVADTQGETPTSVEVSLPLRELLLTQSHHSSRINFEMDYDPATESYRPGDLSLEHLDAWIKETRDPRFLSIFKQVKDLSIPAPEKTALTPNASESLNEGSLTRAEEILKQIAEAYDKGEPDQAYITDLFKQVYTILEIGARRNSESDSVAPQTLKVVEAFMAMATEKGIEISPPKDVTDRVLDWINNISAKGKRDSGKEIETLADPNPEESGEYVGVLAFSGGDPIDIRLGQEEQPLYDASGNVVARVWAGVHQNEQLFIVVEAVEGEQIFIDGEPYGESWIYPQQYPIFTVGGREYRLFQPAAVSAEHSIIGTEATELAPSEKVVGIHPADGEPASEPIGYDSWLISEQTAAGLEMAPEISQHLVEQKQAWIWFHAHQGKNQSNHGVANLYRYPRVLVGSRPMVKSGRPGTEAFQVTLSDGILANEQALIFLDIQGQINLVRLLTPHESQSVLVNGQELRPETPVKVFKDSVIELQGLNGERFQMDLVPHEIYSEQFNGNISRDTLAALAEPRDTSIGSPNVRRLPDPSDIIDPLSRDIPVVSDLHEDTFLGALAQPQDGTMVAGNPIDPMTGPAEAIPGEIPETVALDFTELSRRRPVPKVSESQPELEIPAMVREILEVDHAEDSGGFHIDVDEGSAPKDTSEGSSVEDRFGLPEDAPHEDSMAGFDASFAFDAEAHPLDSVADEPMAENKPESKPVKTATTFGEELENLRARYSIRFGEDPLAGAEPIVEKGGGDIRQVMLNGAVRSVADLVTELSAKLATPKSTAPTETPAPRPRPKTVAEVFGVEAGVLQRAYQSEFQKDPFAGAKAVYGKDGTTVKRVDVDGRVIDLDAFLERLAISIRRQVAANRMAAAASPGSRLSQLAQVWEGTFETPLIGAKQKVLFDEGQPAAIKDQETGDLLSIDDFIAQKESLLERGFHRAEQVAENEPLDPADSSPRVRWIDADAPLSEHVRFIEEELDIRVGEARMVEEQAEVEGVPDPIEELQTGEYQLLDSVPPPPPMAEDRAERPEVLLSPIDLAAAQADFESGRPRQILPAIPQASLELPHPHIAQLISPKDSTFAQALKKAQGDIAMIPVSSVKKGNIDIQGRVNDALGFLDQLRQFTKANDPRENSLATLVVLDHLETELAKLYQGSQDFALRSDGKSLTLSTFLTEGTRSVHGDMGKPSGQIVIPFHADQSKAMMMRTVLSMLQQIQVPIEVTIPLQYKSEGLQSILVKYSDPFVAEVFSQVNEMMAGNMKLFANYPLFMGHQIDYPGEPLAQASHYRLDPKSGESPLNLLKRMIIEARDEVRDVEGDSKKSVFRLKVYEGLKKLGLIQ